MNGRKWWMRRSGAPEGTEMLDPVLRQTLSELKSAVHAWSAAELSRTRTIPAPAAHRVWRMAAEWGLAAALAVGTTSGGVYQYRQHRQAEQAAAARAVEQQKETAVEPAQPRPETEKTPVSGTLAAVQPHRQEAQKEDEMLASVDLAVSRQAPDAMEPLIALAESESNQ